MPIQCSVCLHTERKRIDAFMKANTNYSVILRWVKELHKKDPSIRIWNDKRRLRAHRSECLGLPTLMGGSGTRVKVAAGDELPPMPAYMVPTTDMEITDRARALLADRLNELSAKELHSLVVEGLKFQRADAAARAKERIESDEDDDAKDDLRSALGAIN